MARRAGIPTWSYLCVGADLVMSNHRAEWVVPGSREWRESPDGPAPFPYGFLAPESGWTDLLLARVREFLGLYPVEWLLFDWFGYGGLRPNRDPVVPAEYAREPFRRIIGREMPETAGEITPDEAMLYKRAVLAEQFHRLREAVKETSPQTRIMFNVPYRAAAEEIWIDHPMVTEGDGLFAECSRRDVVEWLLAVRRPEQRVMTTITGRVQEGECDATSWRHWYEQGCDFFGYAWGTPPDFRPHPRYERELAIVGEAFAHIASGES